MSVEKAKVKKRIKVLFPKINFSQKRMDSLVDKLSAKPEDDADDAAIDEVINDYNDLIDFVDLAKDDDRVRKLESEKAVLIKKKTKTSTDEEEEEEEEEEELPADTPSWAKTLIKDNKDLKKEIDGIKSGKVTETKKQQAQKAFNESAILKDMKPEIKEKWMDRLNLESETSFEDQTKELETEFSDLKQSSNDTSHYGGGAGEGTNNNKVDQKDVDSVVDKMNI